LENTISNHPFDYAIIGAGAAGLHLALAIIEDGSFQNKSFLILERDEKNLNDRTWSFWEKSNGKWDSIVFHTWAEGIFADEKGELKLNMGEYLYKTVRSADFYKYAKEIIGRASNFKWVKSEVNHLVHGSPNEIKSTKGVYYADQVFDSRIDPAFKGTHDKHIRLLQHFKGWIIETEKPVFNPDAFMMMDFRLRWKNSTSFTYILPLTKNKALVEFTFFSPSPVSHSVYEEMLKQYIEQYIETGGYQILEKEYGVIPMSNFPFHKFHEKYITKIGTAGGWVKPSTGYSFKNAERFSKIVVANLKKGLEAYKGIGSFRHRKFDTIFLDILNEKNFLGPSLFSSMYRNVPTHLIFKFLDEQTNLQEDIRIISAFQPWPFLQALMRQLLR
jgi:lycopene beta-cyclase